MQKCFEMGEFADKLIDWYDEHKRDLPWRRVKDPYRIWISEIILQQTRVAQGYDYYCRFIERFPDVDTLADAHEDEVMKYWQGLGYYSRARNLHEAAKSIVKQGGFPTTYAGVRSLKGVGDYTAAAVCSFAYDMPCAAVDGNVYRVLARYLGIDEPIDTARGKKLFAALAEELLDKHRPALYNQAIMDFGALQCVPVAPQCADCPLVDSCVAFRQGKINMLPCKQHRTKVTARYFIYLYVRAGEYTFIRRRGAGDIWQNLYEVPLIETAGEISEEALLALPEFADLFAGCQPESVRLLRKKEKHVLSHRVIYADFYEIILKDDIRVLSDYRCVSETDLYKFPMSRLLSRFFSLFLTPD